MEITQSPAFMSSKTLIFDKVFATNNFCAPLSNTDMPKEFHMIQDFLSVSAIGYALTQPAKVTYKSVLQVWETA